MTVVSFAVVIALSIGLALRSRRGHAHQQARDFFVASGQFGAVLVFFLSVGETYSVTSMLGFPGGVYAHGDGFSAWFFGYILLMAPVVFLVGPWIARAGRLYAAATVSDFFARHFESRSLELVITIAAIAVLVPVAATQFIGLKIVLSTLAPQAPPLLLIAGAGALAFCYVVIAGLRASAFVAILKDVLMLGSILLVSGAAFAAWPQDLSPPPPAAIAPITPHDIVFAITTVIVQSVGYVMLPQTWSFLFAARSGDAIRKAQAVAPLYMLMFPLLMSVAAYALFHGLRPRAPDYVFLAAAERLLPAWLVGIVLGGVTLAGLVLVATMCLAVGSLVARNLVSGLGEGAQQRWAKVVIAVYLVLAILLAEHSSRLMVTLNNMIYFGIVQTVPALAAALLFKRVPAVALIGGIVVGDAVAFSLFEFGADFGGLNSGLVGLVPNLLVVGVLTCLFPRTGAASVVERLRRQDAAQTLTLEKVADHAS